MQIADRSLKTRNDGAMVNTRRCRQEFFDSIEVAAMESDCIQCINVCMELSCVYLLVLVITMVEEVLVSPIAILMYHTMSRHVGRSMAHSDVLRTVTCCAQ
jgi:hypothetical protein